MIPSTKALRAAVVAATALLAFPATGLAAASAVSETGTTVGSELSVAAPATTSLTVLKHATPATGSTPVQVTSTQNWSLTATDGAASGNGFMTNGTTPLGLPLQVAVDAASGDLTAAGVPVAGSLVETKTFTFTQALGATENVVAADHYGLTVTYTVSGT